MAIFLFGMVMENNSGFRHSSTTCSAANSPCNNFKSAGRFEVTLVFSKGSSRIMRPDVILSQNKLVFSGNSLNCAPLRKIAAILLLCLLVFNWYGYRFVTSYFQKKADTQLQAKIDVNDYDESQLIEIRVALDMPYQNSSSGFERHYGEIELNGKIYAYVKRKVEDGYLVLKCIPNTVKQNIQNADNILFTANNGLDQEHNGKSNSPLNNLVKSIFSDYDDYSANYNLNNVADNNQRPLHTGTSSFNSVYLPVSEQPPEVALSSLS